MKVVELKEQLKQFKDTDDITPCSCAEEMIITRNGRQIAKFWTIKTNEMKT